MAPPRSHSYAFARRQPDGGDGPGESVGSGRRLDLERLYKDHADDVARWARRLGGPALDVEDIVHEVFLVVQRRLPEWRGEARVTTWLYEITLRVVSDRRRRWSWLRLGPLISTRRGPAAAAADDLEADEPDALARLERREATTTLYRLLDGIGEKYRTVIILFELEGRSGEEIAALTKTSLANVWIRLHRGRQKLARRFLAWEKDKK
jgi:RNA polymerase sigma-70 factor, ECF subfamily